VEVLQNDIKHLKELLLEKEKRLDQVDKEIKSDLTLYISFIAGVLALIGLLGWGTVSWWIKKSIEIRTVKKIDKVLTPEKIMDIIEERGDEIIKQYMEVKVKEIDQLLNEYKHSFDKFPEIKEINRMLTEKINKPLDKGGQSDD